MFSPERADSDAWTHLEAFCVLEVREERLHEVALRHGHDHDGGLDAFSGEPLEIVERCPVAGLRLVRAVVPREWPSVGGGQRYGNEGVGELGSWWVGELVGWWVGS